MTGIYILGGKTARTPGTYCKVDPETGESTGRPLRQTNEYIHPSVRSRTALKGPGVEDEGSYKSEALEDYKVRFIDETANQRPIAVWRPRRKGSKTRELPERYVILGLSFLNTIRLWSGGDCQYLPERFSSKFTALLLVRTTKER